MLIAPLLLEDVQTTSSKLALFLEVRRRGWVLHDAPLPMRQIDGDNLFERKMLTRSAMYLRCILADSDIFRKGATHWIHGMPEGYYKCLVGMNDLTTSHDMANFHALRNNDFLALMAGGCVAAELPPIADGDAEDPHAVVAAPEVAAADLDPAAPEDAVFGFRPWRCRPRSRRGSSPFPFDCGAVR